MKNKKSYANDIGLPLSKITKTWWNVLMTCFVQRTLYMLRKMIRTRGLCALCGAEKHAVLSYAQGCSARPLGSLTLVAWCLNATAACDHKKNRHVVKQSWCVGGLWTLVTGVVSIQLGLRKWELSSRQFRSASFERSWSQIFVKFSVWDPHRPERTEEWQGRSSSVQLTVVDWVAWSQLCGSPLNRHQRRTRQNCFEGLPVSWMTTSVSDLPWWRSSRLDDWLLQQSTSWAVASWLSRSSASRVSRLSCFPCQLWDPPDQSILSGSWPSNWQHPSFVLQ